jgi:LPS O-antigen subunit length determinant protein (WzzB/FepE family)
MIDPTNTEPIPAHHASFARVLSIVAILTLLALALYLLLEERKESEVIIIPLPTPEEIRASSPFPLDTQEAFRAIQEKHVRGEITREEAERQIEELLAATLPGAVPE